MFIADSIDLEDPRSSLNHMVIKRKNIPMGTVPVRIRGRQSQTLDISAKDL